MSVMTVKKGAFGPLPNIPQNMVSMSEGDFAYFQAKVRSLLGIHLSDAKRELLQSRLRNRIMLLKLGDFANYRDYLEGLQRNDAEWQEFINLITTNKTDWFREPAHFEYLKREFLPAWKKTGRTKLLVWSAACSTGEEPYTLAGVLDRELGEGYSYEITATDIDTEVLKSAKNGVYPLARLEQVPENYKSSMFCIGSEEIANWMKIRSHLKENVNFQQINLTKQPYPWTAKFDLILCRNVLIYFPKEEIQKVIDGMFQAAAPGANLLIGHSESLQNIEFAWTYRSPSIFTKSGKRK